MWKHYGRYYLFYSGNEYGSPDYAVGYATSDCITGSLASSHIVESNPGLLVGTEPPIMLPNDVALLFAPFYIDKYSKSITFWVNVEDTRECTQVHVKKIIYIKVVYKNIIYIYKICSDINIYVCIQFYLYNA